MVGENLEILINDKMHKMTNQKQRGEKAQLVKTALFNQEGVLQLLLKHNFPQCIAPIFIKDN